MIGLIIILLLVLFLPFTVKQVEHNLEYFLVLPEMVRSTISLIQQIP